MTYDEAKKRAKELGYEIHSHDRLHTWFNAMKRWNYTGQNISLQVWPEKEEFQFDKMEGFIQITTGKIGSFDSDVQFLRWQKSFMEVIEKLGV